MMLDALLILVVHAARQERSSRRRSTGRRSPRGTPLNPRCTQRGGRGCETSRRQPWLPAVAATASCARTQSLSDRRAVGQVGHVAWGAVRPENSSTYSSCRGSDTQGTFSPMSPKPGTSGSPTYTSTSTPTGTATGRGGSECFRPRHLRERARPACRLSGAAHRSIRDYDDSGGAGRTRGVLDAPVVPAHGTG
jgi:hypothetical protein